MSYFRMLGFYFFDCVGSFLNFIASIFKVYPCFDLGVRYLLLVEGRRVIRETSTQANKRSKKAGEAEKLEKMAKNLDG